MFTEHSHLTGGVVTITTAAFRPFAHDRWCGHYRPFALDRWCGHYHCRCLCFLEHFLADIFDGIDLGTQVCCFKISVSMDIPIRDHLPGRLAC